MPDVHLLGDVRRREVDDDALRLWRRPQLDAALGGALAELLGEPLVSQAEVDEARRSDLGRLEYGRRLDVARDLLRDLERRRAALDW
jgi:hypothetical protein